MLHFLNTIFIENGTLIVWCLYFGGLIIKYFFNLTNKNIIFLNLIFGVIFMIIWIPALDDVPLEIRINRGLVYGFAATGLDQLIQSIIYYIKVWYYNRPGKDRRGTNRINI